MDFGQLITAMVTPFNENNEIDFENTTRLVHYLTSNGSDGLVVAGTTGESATLTFEEKIALFNHVVQIAENRGTVIAGTGTYSTQESIDLTREATNAGVDGIMLVAPYYNRPDQAGLYAHFKAIAEVTPLPIMIYNIPGRSSVNIDAETMIKLSEIDNIVSVKEASANLEQMSTIMEKTKDNFTLYSGDDSLTLPVLSIGGHGVVSVAAHVIGNEMQEMISAYKTGDNAKAASLHRTLLPVMKAFFEQPSPTPVKTAMTFDGINIETGPVRLPLVPLTDSQKASLKQTYDDFKKQAIS